MYVPAESRLAAFFNHKVHTVYCTQSYVKPWELFENKFYFWKSVHEFFLQALVVCLELK